MPVSCRGPVLSKTPVRAASPWNVAWAITVEAVNRKKTNIRIIETVLAVLIHKTEVNSKSAEQLNGDKLR